jgi:hypothetical protein
MSNNAQSCCSKLHLKGKAQSLTTLAEVGEICRLNAKYSKNVRVLTACSKNCCYVSI